MEQLKSLLEEKPEPKILDIGTGRGNFIQLIARLTQNYSEIVGIDANESAVDAARNSFDDKRITFEQMDGGKMTFEDNSFDIVCLSNSLHHLDDVKAIVHEMQRVIAPGGYLLFNEMYSDIKDEKQATHVKMHHFWAEVDRINGVTHNETMKRSEIIKVLEDASDFPIAESWDMLIPPNDEQAELSADVRKFLYNTLDGSLQRVKHTEHFDRLKATVKKLKTRIEKIGFESAAQLITVLQKP